MFGVTVGRPYHGFFAAVLIVAFLVGIRAIPGAAPMEMTPYLQAVTANSVYVLVECDAEEPVKVDYGTTASYGASAVTEGTEPTTNKTFVHNVKLTGLKPNTVYHYRASRQGAASGDYAFRTAVAPGTPFRFAWMADCRSGRAVHDEIAALIDKAGPYFSLYGGDLCIEPTYPAFKNEFFRPNELALIAKVPFFNAAGNHEDWDVNTKAFTQAPASASGTQDYYSFDYGDLHVLVLNTELNTYAGSPQYNFALKDLSSAKRTWKVVIAHKPAYSYTNKQGGDSAMALMAKNIFEPNKVNMVLAGHDHLYQHNLVNGVHHMVIGSAGAGLYDPVPNPNTIKSAKDYNFALVDVTPNVFDMTVYNNKGTILEKISLTKGGPAAGVSTAPVPAPVPPGPAAAPSPAATPSPPSAVILAGGVAYQAEDATIDQGVVETEHAGYTGAGYVNNKNLVGSYVEWTVNAASAGDYTLLFRYANCSGSTRYCDIIVNGTKVANKGFDTAGPIYPNDCRVWMIKTMKVTLRQGKNTIRAVSTVVDGPPNWDRIEIAKL